MARKRKDRHTEQRGPHKQRHKEGNTVKTGSPESVVSSVSKGGLRRK